MDMEKNRLFRQSVFLIENSYKRLMKNCQWKNEKQKQIR